MGIAWKRVSYLWFALLLIAVVGLSAPKAHAQSPGGHQFVADVNGDGKADAITFDKNTGDWWVALGNGTNGFGAPSRWSTGYGVGSTSQFVADVDGDGKADAIAWYPGSSALGWQAGLSNGTSFGTNHQLYSGAVGVGSDRQFVADVTGDGFPDFVFFWASSGTWVYVRNSGSLTFGPGYGTRITGHGVGSANQFVADVDGDGKADAVLMLPDGAWWVALSSSDGNSFLTPSSWFGKGHGAGSSSQFVGDVNGDGKSDALVGFLQSQGNWYAAISNGSAFNNGSGQFYFPPLASCGYGVGSSNQMLRDINNDGKADIVTFDKNTGDWWIETSNTAFGQSNCNNFGSPVRWISGFGVGTN